MARNRRAKNRDEGVRKTPPREDETSSSPFASIVLKEKKEEAPRRQPAVKNQHLTSLSRRKYGVPEFGVLLGKLFFRLLLPLSVLFPSVDGNRPAYDRRRSVEKGRNGGDCVEKFGDVPTGIQSPEIEIAILLGHLGNNFVRDKPTPVAVVAFDIKK